MWQLKSRTDPIYSKPAKWGKTPRVHCLFHARLKNIKYLTKHRSCLKVLTVVIHEQTRIFEKHLPPKLAVEGAKSTSRFIACLSLPSSSLLFLRQTRLVYAKLRFHRHHPFPFRQSLKICNNFWTPSSTLIAQKVMLSRHTIISFAWDPIAKARHG